MTKTTLLTQNEKLKKNIQSVSNILETAVEQIELKNLQKKISEIKAIKKQLIFSRDSLKQDVSLKRLSVYEAAVIH